MLANQSHSAIAFASKPAEGRRRASRAALEGIQERQTHPVQLLVGKRLPEPICEHAPVLKREGEIWSELILPVDHIGLIAVANADYQLFIAIVFDAVAEIRAEVLP